MSEFKVTVTGTLNPNEEIDSYQIFTIEDARKNIRRPSLAQAFLDGYFDEKYSF